MARRERRDLSVFEWSCHLPTCLPHTAEASHCPFNCWMSSREAVNTNFYSLRFDPTGNRTRVYRFSSRRSIHSTSDRSRWYVLENASVEKLRYWNIPVLKMSLLKMSIPVLRMLVLSNHGKGKCRFQKVSVLEIPIRNIPVSVLENTDTIKSRTRKRQYSVPPWQNNEFFVTFFACWGLI